MVTMKLSIRRFTGFMLVVALLCLTVFANAWSAIGDDAGMSILIPKLKKAPAPSWVKVGLRMTFHAISATVAGSGRDWKQDENGAWETADGRRWSGGEKATGSSNGFIQLDVTALTADTAVMLVSYYLIPQPGTAPILSLQYPIVGRASCAGGFWVNPTYLKTLKNRNTSMIKVVRMPYTANGKKRPAVWIQSKTERNKSLYVYDEQTGALLHDSIAVEGAPPQVIGHDEPSNTASTTLAQGTLLVQRVVKYPWVGQSAKAWATSAQSIAMQGATAVMVTGGSPPAQIQQQLSATVTKRGPSWVLYHLVVTTQGVAGMPPSSTSGESVTGLGQFGGAWLPPAILAKMQVGQTIDSDPITGVTVAVAGVDDNWVLFTATNQSQILRWGYNKHNGALSLLDREDFSQMAHTQTRFVLPGM
jgi:hypothetical protein